MGPGRRCVAMLRFLGPILSVVVPGLVGVASLLWPGTVHPAGTGYTWRSLRIGAGGYITGLDISADGSTRVVRTDTYGAYVWDSGLAQWTQLVTSSTMPTADVGVDKHAGVYEIRVAPSLPTRLYMSYRGFVYRSDDRGATWTRTAFLQVSMNANDGYRMYGQKMAVDPANPDVVYVGTPENGLFVTTNGGTNWPSVTAMPVAQTGKAGITGIAFDASSGTTGGKTNTLYASSYGEGVYRSTDAGISWTPLTGGPSNVTHGVIATDGAYYATGNDGASVWRYLSGAWTNITPDTTQVWNTIVSDPFDPTHIVAIREGGYPDVSHDRGASWAGIAWYHSRVATDIPWLAWTREEYMSVGDMLFDPVTPNQLWFAEGIGVWTTTLPQNFLWNTPVVWSSQSIGIEQLVANVIVAPPGGRPVLGSWDRPLFYSADPDVFPLQHGPNNAHSIVMGWSIDYASTDPTFLVALTDWWGIEETGYSTNGGQTWTTFPTFPAWPTTPIGGSITASTPDNIVWAPSNNQAPYYTKNRGGTWTKISLPGVLNDTTANGWGGISWAYYLNRHIVTADRVNPGTFYIYHYVKGLFRSTNGGDSWSLMHAGEIAPFSGFNAKLKSVPDHAGHLFFTSGQQSGTDPSGAFMRSTDAGATWTAVPNVLEVYAFGFGKEIAAGSYPAIFIAGWVGGVYGIWRSDDAAESWTQIGDFPLGSLDEVKAVDGDKNVYGTVYLGFNGSGYAYGEIVGSNLPATPTGLVGTAVSSTQVNLGWNPSPGGAGYHVIRNGARIAATTATSYLNNNLTPSTPYTYAVSAYDPAGDTSAPSAPVTVTTPPTVPTGLVGTAVSATQVQLTWNPSSGATGYNVIRNGVEITTSTTTSYLDDNLKPTTSYTYAVSAYDVGGDTSPLSTSVTVTTPNTTGSSGKASKRKGPR